MGRTHKWIFSATFVARAAACSNFLVPAGSSEDGSTILAYNDDQPMQTGALSHWLGGQHEAGELRSVYDWDSEAYLGAIPQPAVTYNVIGNTNEHQLAIAETTFGGLQALDGSNFRAVCSKHGCLDYASLIWITLARARNATEAIRVIDDLLQTYGYASSGESFSIADPHEVWLMEIIGKGNYSKGAVWVATRIPDGSVCAHANQARTTEFLADKPDRFRFAPDVVDFARSLGLYSGKDEAFSFSDVFDPVTPYSARTCEARVYSFFRRVAAPEEKIDQHLDYVQGRNLRNRMPLYVKAGHRISINETFWLMRDHYEGTEMDGRFDVGAGNWNDPTRLGSEGAVWSVDGKRYMNERPIGVPFTQWNLVSSQRKHHPFGVMWFGVDDSSFTLRAPFYGVTSRVPAAWDDANCTGFDDCRKRHGLPGTVQEFSMDSMYWVTNLVANYAYSRYDAIAPAVYRRLASIEARLFDAVAKKDAELAGIDDMRAAVEAASSFSYDTAEELHKEWRAFFGELFTTYMDGYEMVPSSEGNFPFKKVGGSLRPLLKAEVASQTGEKYLLPGLPLGREVNLAAVIDKRRLRAFGRRDDKVQDSEVFIQGGLPSLRAASLYAAIFLVGALVGSSASRRVRAAPGGLEEPLT